MIVRPLSIHLRYGFSLGQVFESFLARSSSCHLTASPFDSRLKKLYFCFSFCYLINERDAPSCFTNTCFRLLT